MFSISPYRPHQTSTPAKTPTSSVPSAKNHSAHTPTFSGQDTFIANRSRNPQGKPHPLFTGALHDAAKTGNMTALTAIKLPEGRKYDIVNTIDSDGKTPFVYACENGHIDVAIYLANNSADIDMLCNDKSPVEYARDAGQHEIYRLLIDHFGVLEPKGATLPSKPSPAEQSEPTPATTTSHSFLPQLNSPTAATPSVVNPRMKRRPQRKTSLLSHMQTLEEV